MKIILLEDIHKRGKKGAVIEENDTYGKYLIKEKKAEAGLETCAATPERAATT